jgi:neutral ceramidase
MWVLRFDGTDGRPIGVLSWFAVHVTSMENNNHLISGDNKGYAAYLFEREQNADYAGKAPFVAAFANSNAGDVSPNTAGDLDGDKDWDCEANENVACTEESGKKQFEKAWQLYGAAAETIDGPLDWRYDYVDFSGVAVDGAFTHGKGPKKTCPAAIGLSMLAGAVEDGPGIGKEGQTCKDLGLLLKGLMCQGGKDKCQGVKPIALQPGKQKPYPGAPEVLPLQIVRLGQLALVAVPAELTTMAGRRLRKTAAAALEAKGVKHFVVAGYANAYAGYVTTWEEYQAQDYEGASTHFGEWTLAAYRQEMARLAQAMAAGKKVSSKVKPRDILDTLSEKKLTYNDAAPPGGFGSVITDAKSSYTPGAEVEVVFWGANLSNGLLTQSTFLEVQQLSDGVWDAVARDWGWDTFLEWKKTLLGRSKITVRWRVPEGAPAGTYRILHRGFYRTASGNKAYSGTSRSFTVGK